MKNIINRIIDNSIEVKQGTKKLTGVIEKIAVEIERCYRNGNKVILFGNGGSAADCQHLATELVCRFEKERKSLNAISLTANTSLLTAISNDYGFERMFSRQVESIAEKGDVIIAISTSGNSPNVLEAAKVAKRKGAVVIGFTGANGGKLKKVSDIILQIPSNITARVQEAHIMVGHIICKLIEDELL